MLATTLAWHVHNETMVITERTLWSASPHLPSTLDLETIGGSSTKSAVLEQYVHEQDILDVSKKMDRWNPSGFYNFFGSFTFKNDVGTALALAGIFREEVNSIKNANGLQVYIVYNPVTVEAMTQMSKRGGNTLGMKLEDGPLIS